MALGDTTKPSGLRANRPYSKAPAGLASSDFPSAGANY